nr:hypothetical protein [Tepidicaulis marinus]
MRGEAAAFMQAAFFFFERLGGFLFRARAPGADPVRSGLGGFFLAGLFLAGFFGFLPEIREINYISFVRTHNFPAEDRFSAIASSRALPNTRGIQCLWQVVGAATFKPMNRTEGVVLR